MNHACRAASVAYVAFALTMVAAPIRAATPITKCGTVITSPGSYVVTKNLTVKKGSTKDCITVDSNYVTVDLGGFTINCGGQSVEGIFDGGTNLGGIIVRDGTIAGCASGVNLEASTAVLIDRVAAVSNSFGGILPGSGSSVVASISSDNGIDGIIFTACPASAIDNTALGNAVSNISTANPATGGCNLFNNLAP